MKRKLLLLAMFLGLQYAAFAQTKNVKGIVTDAQTNTPLPGVSITVPGTTIGTVTNTKGEFSLNTPDDVKQVRAAFLGYGEQIIVLTGNPLRISLAANNKSLNEVVVVGYGTSRKKDLTGSISTVSGNEIAGRQTIQVTEALQGAVPGMSVTRSNSAPGAGSSILIRGITTLGNSAPLFIVDGVPVGNIDNINGADIASLTVLKDGASAAIYGSRGAAGVILITTKRGVEGKTNLEYSYQYGLQKATALPKYVDAPTYMSYFNEQSTNDGAASGPYKQDYITHFADSLAKNPNRFPFANTDWLKLILTNKYAPRQEHNLSFTAGAKNVKTRVSLGYQKVGAFYDNYNYERYLVRVNNDVQVTSRISANIDLGLRRTNTLSPVANPFSGQTPFYEAEVMPPVYAAYYTNGAYALAKDGRNPLAQLQQGGTQETHLNQMQGRLALNYKPVDDITITALVAPTFDLDKSKSFSKKITYTNPDGSPTTLSNTALSVLSEGRTEAYQLTSQVLIYYNKVFAGRHSVTALAGYESLDNQNESLNASRQGFVLTDFPYLDSGSQQLRDNSGNASEVALHSYFGRITYDFDKKYYVQGNLRDDQSSRFAPAYRKALFPSFSAGWVISQEKFMKNIPWLSFLKLRGSYGEVGNERIGNYPYQATIDFSTALFYQNGAVVPLNGGAQTVYAVNNISWETTRTTDIGLDATVFNDRLSITADYYKKRTYDILLGLDIPLNLGYDKPQQNAGIMDIKGWDLALNWHDNINKLKYSIGFNISDARSKVIDMKGTQLLGDQATFLGSEFNGWYGYRSAGLYQTKADATASARTSTAVTAGDIKYIDQDGNGIINANDRVLLGGSLPRYQYGGNINLAYGAFDLGVTFQGIGKRLSRLNSDVTRPFLESFGNFPQLLAGNFWSLNNTPAQNLAAKYPRLSNTSANNNYTFSDYWLINGAYFRIKNATLGYTLRNTNFLKRSGIESFRIFIGANDFFTSSKFPKYTDPESGNASYPIVTTFLIGGSVKF
jgi:TonB-linked SusC/RagA family outer membrane protein